MPGLSKTGLEKKGEMSRIRPCITETQLKFLRDLSKTIKNAIVTDPDKTQ